MQLGAGKPGRPSGTPQSRAIVRCRTSHIAILCNPGRVFLKNVHGGATDQSCSLENLHENLHVGACLGRPNHIQYDKESGDAYSISVAGGDPRNNENVLELTLTFDARIPRRMCK